MPVYIIRAGEAGPVKIGHAADPQQRLGDLQVAHWERLTIIRLFVGGMADERVLHVRFSAHVIRGEWFNFTPEMMGDLGLEEIIRPPVASKYPPALKRVLETVGGPLKLARALGIGASAVTQWTRIPPRHLPRVEQITGIAGRELRPDLWEPPAASQDAAA
jgi:DNA-binding transcriptional regulator YdaS (Cro superfamily)